MQPTSKGQITIPKEWRKKFPTSNFLIKPGETKLEIIPVYIDELTKEDIIFDAERDNQGKGVSPEELITLMRKAGHG